MKTQREQMHCNQGPTWSAHCWAESASDWSQVNNGAQDVKVSRLLFLFKNSRISWVCGSGTVLCKSVTPSFQPILRPPATGHLEPTWLNQGFSQEIFTFSYFLSKKLSSYLAILARIDAFLTISDIYDSSL